MWSVLEGITDADWVAANALVPGLAQCGDRADEGADGHHTGLNAAWIGLQRSDSSRDCAMPV